MSDAKTASTQAVLGLASESTITQALWICSFAALTAVGAQIEIPIRPVPFTMQTLFVLLAGGLLGKRNGFISMALYLGLGIAGVPVFSSAGFGLARILGPTGGYLLAFPVAAYVSGALTEHKQDLLLIGTSMFISLVLIFTLGTLQLGLVLRDWNAAVTSGFLIFSIWDFVKFAAATAIVYRFRQTVGS